MKTSLLPVLLASLLVLPIAHGQEPVTTGTVQKVNMETGEVTILSDQTHRPMVFTGLQQASMVSTKGGSPQMADLHEGMPITLQYAVQGKQWIIEKVIFGDAATPDSTAPASGTVGTGTGAMPMPMTPGMMRPTNSASVNNPTPPNPNSTSPSAVRPQPTLSGNSSATLPGNTSGTTPPGSMPQPAAAMPAMGNPVATPAPSNKSSGGSAVRNRSGGNAPQ